MKKQKKKKRKPKKKWCKQCGDFIVRHIVETNSGAYAHLFFKDECIGAVSFMHVPQNRSTYKDSYDLFVYEINSVGILGKTIGKASCGGVSHTLPKAIFQITLDKNCNLFSNRKVLIEKVFSEEKIKNLADEIRFSILR